MAAGKLQESRAGNLVAEHEWKTDLRDGIVENTNEMKLEIHGGMSYCMTNQFSLGFEAVQQNVVEKGKIKHAALFAGPVVSYATDAWWVTLSVLPQITGMAGATIDGLNLEEYERSQIRLLMSFHL
jgi:hypothetical protein